MVRGARVRTARNRRIDPPPKRPWVEAVERWFGRAQNFHGFLLAIFGTSVNTYFGISEAFPPYLVMTIGMGTLVLVTLAYSVAASRLGRLALVGGILILSGGTTLYALHVQHVSERRQYESYQLEYAGFFTDVLISQEADTGRKPRQLAGIQLGVTFDNPNDFPLYAKSIRRYVTFAGKASGDEQESVTMTLPARSHDARFVDSEILFRPPLSVPPETVDGTIDFTLCYGRSPDKLNKSFRMKGKLVFPVWPDGWPHSPDFYPADDEATSHGHNEGCPE